MYMGSNLRRTKLASLKCEKPLYQNIYQDEFIFHWPRLNVRSIVLGSRETLRS